jgi:hypothetical protein
MERTKIYTKHSGRKFQDKKPIGVEGKSGMTILKLILGKREEIVSWV